MDEERDLIDFEDDQGNKITLEAIDYFFYEGNEYAMLVDADDEDPEECDTCERENCNGCTYQQDVYIMQVVPVGEEDEEFVEVDEELARTLIDLYTSGAFEDDDYEEDDE